MTLQTAAHYTYPQTQVSYPPAASLGGTAAFLMGLGLAYLESAGGQTPSDMAGRAAFITLMGLAVSVLFDMQKGLRNLFRTDFMCLVGLYGLTLLEFLFPQPDFNSLLTTAQTAAALRVILLGMAGIAIGRHWITPRPMRSPWLNFGAVSSQLLFKALVVAAFLGYLNMLLAVKFNPMALIDGMLGPRFSEPWARGAIGGISSLISELSLMLNAIPPLAGVLWNRRRQFSRMQLVLVLAILALTFFQGFSGGTRNVFVAYAATFLVGYLLTLPKNTIWNTLIPIGVMVVVVGYATYHMLEFRTIGLRSYMTDKVYESDTIRSTLAVDYNLWSLGLLVDAFPQKHDFIGSEVLTWALVKPIPRVFWPGKPLGLSVSIEEIVGAEGWTVAATYLGEAYMMAGTAGVIGVSLGFGVLCAWWNRLALQRQSDYAMLVFALGFFVLAVSMRSMFWLTTTALPIVALIVIRKYVLR
jgi:oligosaccharide repeat unit polymerase